MQLEATIANVVDRISTFAKRYNDCDQLRAAFERSRSVADEHAPVFHNGETNGVTRIARRSRATMPFTLTVGCARVPSRVASLVAQQRVSCMNLRAM